MADKTYNDQTYSPDTDYATEIENAIKANDLDSAKTNNDKRNAKIAGEGLGYDDYLKSNYQELYNQLYSDNSTPVTTEATASSNTNDEVAKTLDAQLTAETPKAETNTTAKEETPAVSPVTTEASAEPKAQVSYDKDTNYAALIDESMKNGDWASAKAYNEQRNAKIEGEGLEYDDYLQTKYGEYIISEKEADPTPSTYTTASGASYNLTYSQAENYNGNAGAALVSYYTSAEYDPQTADKLLAEYNNLDSFYTQMETLINQNTAEMIELNNQAVDATTKAEIASLSYQLDQAKASYAEQRATAEYQAMVNRDNQALLMATQGDYGGIGQKQYSSSMAEYDAAIRQIDLAQIALEYEFQYQIATAKANGDYSKIQSQISIMTSAYEQLTNLATTLQEYKINIASSLDSYNQTERQLQMEAYQFEMNYALEAMESDRSYQLNLESLALQQAELDQNTVLNKINTGMTVTAADMAVFGLEGDAAAQAALNFNNMTELERRYTIAQYKAAISEANGSTSTSSGSGSSSGSDDDAVIDSVENMALGLYNLYGSDTTYDRVYANAMQLYGVDEAIAKAVAEYYNDEYLIPSGKAMGLDDSWLLTPKDSSSGSNGISLGSTKK